MVTVLKTIPILVRLHTATVEPIPLLVLMQTQRDGIDAYEQYQATLQTTFKLGQRYIP